MVIERVSARGLQHISESTQSLAVEYTYVRAGPRSWKWIWPDAA